MTNLHDPMQGAFSPTDVTRRYIEAQPTGEPGTLSTNGVSPYLGQGSITGTPPQDRRNKFRETNNRVGSTQIFRV